MEEIENCLLCFTKCDDWILLNSEKGVNLNVKEIVLKHFWLQIQNDFAQAICLLCWKHINSFHEFYIRIETIHKSNNQKLKIIKDSIRNVLPTTNDTDKINKTTSNLIELPNVSIKSEASMTIREEVFITVPGDIKNEESDVDNNECNIENCNEGYDVNGASDDDHTNNDNDEEIEEDEGDVDEECDQFLSLPLAAALKPSPPSKKRKTIGTRKSEKMLKTTIKRIRKKKPSLKPKPDYTEQNEKLRRYFNMSCELCGEQLTELSETKKHYRDKHDKEGYIKCCGTKFWEMSKAMQHYEWHENPEAFKCQSCEKCFADKYKLKLHVERNHTPASELNFDCDLCKKSFGRKYLFLLHKKISHPREEDKIYNCDACGLKFAVKGFLRAHVKRVHEYGDSRVCDICARFFKCAKAYDHHYLVQHTNTLHKVQCELCGTWVKHAESLKGHMLRQHRAFIKQSCAMCGKTCPNKKALASHVRTVHEFIEYPCTICEKPFKKKQTLKEHMAQHTGEKDLYKCLFCTKTFRSSANMYAHRKRAHPKEYEENRLLGKKYPDLHE